MELKDLRVVFMGTPDFARKILQELDEHTNVVLVVSKKDAPVGRKKIITPSHVKKYALEHGIKVFTPDKIREDYDEVIKANPDIIVTCAYGQIVPSILLELPKYKAINVHASLLPKLRGGAPIQRAIMGGEDKTGITIMYMDAGMDSGDIISQIEVPISDDDTLDTLRSKLEDASIEILVSTIKSIVDGTNDRIKQNDEEVTFAKIIKKDDEKIDFHDSVKMVYDKIRALNSEPGAYFTLNGEVVKVYDAIKSDKIGEASTVTSIYKDGIGIGCADGEIILKRIKPAGKKEISVSNYLNGVNKDELKKARINE